jgi:hypothetical protein
MSPEVGEERKSRLRRPTSESGQKQTLRRVRARSIHTRIADIALLHWHVRLVPTGDIREMKETAN